MAIIKKYNPKVNTTYVYESVSYWDKELKQPRSKRKLIGKIDPLTGEIVPTSGRGRKPSQAQADVNTPEVHKTSAPAPSSEQIQETVFVQEDDSQLRSLYEDCRRKLLEKEAALAKAESTVAHLQSEKQELITQLELLLKRLNR